MSRLQSPLLKQNNTFHEISFEAAFTLIAETGKQARENETLIMSTGNYANEELYLLQRLARAALHTNAIASFDYYRRGTAFFADKNDIVPLAELGASSLFVCAFDNTVEAAPQLLVQKTIDSFPDTPHYLFDSPDALHIADYAAFFRTLNYYLIAQNLAKGIYIEGLGKNYKAYKENLLAENYDDLLGKNNLANEDVAQFVQMVQKTDAPVFLIWERFLSTRAVIELENLCMLLDIQAKPASGFLCVKAEINSQGLFDMGIFPDICVGGESFTPDTVKLMQNLYGSTISHQPIDIPQALQNRQFTNCILLNNNNIKIPQEVLRGIEPCRFKVLHATDTEQIDLQFDLIIPASLPQETGGIYTDFTKVPHSTLPLRPCPIQYNTFQQLEAIGRLLNLMPLNTLQNVFIEYISFFKGGCRSEKRHFFR